MNNLIKFVEKFFFLILAIIIILAFIAVSANAQTKNAEFNAFTINNGGDYTLAGNIKGMNKINAERGTNYANYWEMFEAYKKAQVIKTPLQQYMGIRKYDSQVKSIFDVPASRVDNVAKISFIDSISFSFTFRPLVIKKQKITFGDTLILGKSKSSLNIILHKNIILSDEKVLMEIKARKWLRIKAYTYVRVASKPDFSISLKSTKTAKRAGIKKSIWEGKCDRKKGDLGSALSIIILIILYAGVKNYEKRKLNCQIQEWQWYYES